MFREFDGNKLGVYLKDYQDGEKLELKDIERYKKMGVEDRTQAAIKAIRENLIV